MAVDFSVPNWLAPMNQAQRAALKLDQDQVAMKAEAMLKKQIGLQKMKQESQLLMQQGLDEGTARNRAMFNNSDLIFADQPAALASLLARDEANDIRRHAQDILQTQRERANTLLEDKNEEIERRNRALEEERRLNRLSREQYQTGLAAVKSLEAERDMLKTQNDILYKQKSYELDVREERRQMLKVIGDDTRYQMAAAKVTTAQSQLEKSKKGNWRGIVDPLKVATAQANVEAAKRELDDITNELMGEQEKKAVGGPTAEGPGDTFLQSDAPPARRETSEPARDQQDPLGIRSLLRK